MSFLSGSRGSKFHGRAFVGRQIFVDTLRRACFKFSSLREESCSEKMAYLAERRRRAALQLEVGGEKILDDGGRWGKVFLLLLAAPAPQKSRLWLATNQPFSGAHERPNTTIDFFF